MNSSTKKILVGLALVIGGGLVAWDYGLLDSLSSSNDETVNIPPPPVEVPVRQYKEEKVDNRPRVSQRASELMSAQHNTLSLIHI